MKHTVPMHYARSTKGTFVYEADETADSPAVRTVYIGKYAMQSVPFDRIVLTIDEVRETPNATD